MQDKLKAGIEAARLGDKPAARRLLRQVVDAEPNNEIAWMWLASVAESLQERRMCLERVVRLNPKNARAREALQQLDAIAGPSRRPGGQAQAARRRSAPPAPARGFNPAYAVVIGIAAVAVIAAVIFGGALSQQPPTPNPATRASFDLLLNTATFTPTADPRTFTATPFYGVIVAAPSNVPTLPPTFTPTFTFTPSATPPPTATPLPLSVWGLLYAAQPADAPAPNLFRALGDGTGAELLAQGITDFAYDPTGTRLAFVKTVTTTTDQGEVVAPELFIAPIDNLEAARRLTTLGSPLLSSPTWAPDGIQLAFVSDFGGNEDLYYITEDGNNLRPLTQNPGVDRDPAWSPQGDVIIYASDQGGRPNSGFSELFSITPDGAVITQLTRAGGRHYHPAWSPDGSRIVYASDRNGDGDIFIANPDGSDFRLLTVDDGKAEDRRPVFTPNGQTVVFISNRDSSTFQLYAVDLSGLPTNLLVTRITDVNANLVRAAYRPEPRLILR